MDGDTSRSRAGVRYRLLGLDAPETNRAQCDEELLLGMKAKWRLEKLIASGEARITESGKLDKFGRTLATLTVNGNPETVSFNPSTQKWEATFRVTQFGENVLYGTAKDASNNTGEDTVSVYAWAGDDNNPPNLKILKPAKFRSLMSRHKNN